MQHTNTHTQNKDKFGMTAALLAMGVDCPEIKAQVLAVGLWWPYYIRLLDESHIPAMIELQNAHGEGQIIARDEKTLRAHFNDGHEAFGVFHEGRLVAQSIMRTDVPPTAASGALARAFNKVSIMGGVVVAPEARGKGMLDTMIGLWHDRAEKQGVDLLHARVRPENERSWQVFMRKGLCITGCNPSPDDGTHDVFMLHKPLSGAFALESATTLPMRGKGSDISGYLARGYIATAWNPHQRQFTLAKIAP